MYLALQCGTYLSTYDIPLPVHVEIYNNEIIKMVEFHLLDPEELIKSIWDPDFTLKEWIVGSTGGGGIFV